MAVWLVTLLSQILTVRSSHFTRTCKSAETEMCCYWDHRQWFTILKSDFESYLEQELKKSVGFFVFQADDTACEPWVDVQGFFAGRLKMVS